MSVVEQTEQGPVESPELQVFKLNNRKVATTIAFVEKAPEAAKVRQILQIALHFSILTFDELQQLAAAIVVSSDKMIGMQRGYELLALTLGYPTWKDLRAICPDNVIRAADPLINIQ